MDMDFRNILIFAGVVAMIVAALLATCSVQRHDCRVEAIKAGMKGEEVEKACRT